jgi:hypothetical protein
MKTLDQHFREQPHVLLRGIAQNQGLLIDDAGRAQYREALVAKMLEKQQVAAVWQDLPAAMQAAIRVLQHEENRMPSPVFQRRFGDIRRFGTGQLQRLKPWKEPANVAEQLWFLGMITRGFVETPDGLVEFVSIPTDLFSLLPPPDSASERFAFPATVVKPQRMGNDQPSSCDVSDCFLNDLATILLYIHQVRVWVGSEGDWRAKDLQQLSPMLQGPPDSEEPLFPGSRLSLLFHCARMMGFLTTRRRRQRLNIDIVLPWLEQTRSQQAAALFDAWRNSPDWNDLCLTPGLHCQRGNWRNDPLITRNALLDMLSQAQPGQWYSLDAFIGAIYEQQPDFQRLDGNYDTWYIRDDTGFFLRGFQYWHQVEGRLIRYLWSGPLHWLGLIELDGENRCWRLTPAGSSYLEPDSALLPALLASPALVVTEDFHITLPANHRLYDRFRVARFCEWERSAPVYVYRITQRGLRRAATAGISPKQILEFLLEAGGDDIPANIRSALSKFTP